MLLTLLLLSLSPFIAAGNLPRQTFSHSPCRFAPNFTQAEIIANSSSFLDDIFYWEGQFHQNRVGYNTANGMTYDGTLLDPNTGNANFSGLHQFSAASKEALQIMVYAHAIAGDPRAARFVNPHSPSDAPETAAGILTTKLQTYLQFNATYPGFGGFLPWFLSNETQIQPTSDWVNRVPALDNGELIWAVYAAVQALHQSKNTTFNDLGNSWQKWLDYTKTTAAHLFYLGSGKVCAVTDLNQTLPVFSPHQNITCEGSAPGQPGLLNDPFEGELFTWWLYFFSPSLTKSDRTALWTVKRPQLVRTTYRGSIVSPSTYHSGATQNYTSPPGPPQYPLTSRPIGPITVQKGFWYSSHESWKLLELPYLDIPLVSRLFHNAERVRTCNSVLQGRTPGMYASVNNITYPSTSSTPAFEIGAIEGYISNAGIPGISNQTAFELDIVTPYAIFPTLLFNQSVGLSWYLNVLQGKGMQNPYGSTESTRRDGTGISSFVSWDSKITTVNALLGGVTALVRAKMKQDKIYHDFITITTREYGRVFGNKLQGEDVQLCLPNFQVPVVNVTDFPTCGGVPSG